MTDVQTYDDQHLS